MRGLNLSCKLSTLGSWVCSNEPHMSVLQLCQFYQCYCKLSLLGLKEEKNFSLAFLLRTENVFSLYLVCMCSYVFIIVMVHCN